MNKELISQAIKALELIDIYLYSASVDRFEHITDESYPEDMFQQNKLKVGADFYEPDGDAKTCKQIINAKVTLGARFAVTNDNDTKILSEVEACFIAKYAQKYDASEEAISEFMKYNVIHNVWPFWREHAFRVSSEARLPRPMISLYKEQPTSNEAE